jgi:tetratricopeptide (TPR) repeat protein
MTASLAVALLAFALAGPAEMAEEPKATKEDMGRAARAFLATLDGGTLAKARLPFDSDQRFDWYYIPRERHGLPLKGMSAAQQEAALDLLRAGLSEKGYTKTQTIVALEPVLAEIESNPVRRDPALYYVTIFGDPAPDGTWGWRFEGHHVALHWTVVSGRSSLASTPQFLGAHPAEVRGGPKAGLRALAAEEDLARNLLRSLSDEQRREAVVSETAPNDILTTNTRQAAIAEARGLPYARLTEAQRGMLLALLEEHASLQRPEVAAERLGRVREAGIEKLVFAWMGGPKRGQGHYYRIQGPTFVVEYDNTQNGANHIHTVWRDFRGDFGRDLLTEHYRTSDHHAGSRDEPQYVSATGRKYYAQPDAQGQVAEARKKSDAEPKNVALLIALGDAHAAVLNHREAITVYDRAFELDKTNALLHQQRGHRHLSIRRFDQARADLEKAVAMDAKLGSAWYYLGLLDYLAGRFDQAAASYERNLSLVDGDLVRGIAAVDWLYMSYRRGGQTEKARELLERVTPDLKIEGNPRLYFHRLLFYKGLRTEDDLLAGSPSDVERTTLLYGIGNFHLYGGDRARARSAFEQATSTTAWNALAFIAAENDLKQLR